MRIHRLTALLIMVALAVSYLSYPVEALSDSSLNTVRQGTEVFPSDWSYLLINDHEIKKEDIIIREKSGEDYILINAEVLKTTFKYPYLDNIYPDFSREGDSLAVTWSDKGKPLLKIIMQVDNPVFAINGQDFDGGMEPIKIGEAFYIPIDPFIEALDMKLDRNALENGIAVQYGTDFAKDILVGYWSDINTNLFTECRESSQVAQTLAGSAIAYIYNADGTYRLRMLSSEGPSDSFLEQSGKYKILGNTIMHYDIRETLYKGTPFILQHRNRLLDKPVYSFIDNYYPDLKKIVINQIPVMKKCQ